jgi:ferredoxin
MTDVMQLQALATTLHALAGTSTADAIGIVPAAAFGAERLGILGEVVGSNGALVVVAQRVVDPAQLVRFHNGETSRESRVSASLADALLRDASWRVVEILTDAGHRACIARNLRYGSPRGAEHDHAIPFVKAGELAGMGSRGRSQLLIHPQWGPWLLLAAVLTNAELPCDKPRKDSPCGHCDACIRACPAGALTANGLNAEACRNRIGPGGRALDQRLSAHGSIACDECRRACPIGEAPPRLGEGETA